MLRIAVSSVVLSVAILMLLVLPSHGYAPAKRAKGAAPSTGQIGPFAAQIDALRQVRQMLHDRPNHNYAGHRVRAIHEITEAIHSLRAMSNTTAKGKGKGKGHAKGKGAAKAGKAAAAKGAKVAAVHEPQALSDQQMRAAAVQLGAIQKALPPAAAAHVGNAIREIGIALTIR